MAKKWTAKDLERLQREGVIRGSFVKNTQQNMFDTKPERKAKNNEEYELQCNCKDHFDKVYPELTPIFFHVPNQAVIDSAKIGAMLKRMGRRRGVWDSFLQVPRDEWWGLWIEFKVGNNDLTEEQKQFRDLSRQYGCKYKWIIIRNSYQFAIEVENYLKTGRLKFQ